MKILSIDALGNKRDGYEWNTWYTVGEIDADILKTLDTYKKIAMWMHENGYTTTADMRKINIEDDGYNIALSEKKTGQPVFAIEYGPEIGWHHGTSDKDH